VCTTSTKASLPPTPTSTIETHFGSRVTKRRRADRYGSDGGDEDPPTKRLVTVNEGGLGFDSLFAEYIKGATGPIHQTQEQLHAVLEHVRTLHMHLQTQGDEHTTKHEGHVQSIDGLRQRIATVEQGTSDVSKLRDDTSKHTTKLSQLEQDVKSKATTTHLDQRINEQNARVDGLDGKHQQTADLVESHKAQLQKQRVGLENRMTSDTIRKLVGDAKSELDKKTHATDAVAQEASKLGQDLSLKFEQYRTEAQANTTAGLNHLNSRITPLSTEATALRADITALQTTSIRHDDVLELTKPMHKDLAALEGEHKKLSGDVGAVTERTNSLEARHEKLSGAVEIDKERTNSLEAHHNKLSSTVEGIVKKTDSIEARHEKLSGAVEGVVKKTDTMQQSIDTFKTQTKLFQTHLDIVVPKTSKDIQSLTSRVEGLEQKITVKTDTSTSKKISPKTPGGSSEPSITLDKMYKWQCEHKKGLTTHDEKFKEDRKMIVDLKTRINDQERDIATLKEKVTQAEADNKQLRDEFEAEKIRTDGAFGVMQILTQQLEVLQKQIASPPVNTTVNRPSAGSPRRRSLQAEAVPDDPIEKLNKRVDLVWTKFVDSETSTSNRITDIANTVNANKTLTDAQLSSAERVTKENGTRIVSLERVGNNNDKRINEDGTRIDSLQRVGNNNDQRINELRQDLGNRFASAVAHNDAGFRFCQNIFENEIRRFAALIDKRIHALENAPSTAGSALEARKERFSGKPRKTDAVPGVDQRVVALEADKKLTDDRVAALETDKKLTQLAMESYSTSVQVLNERMSKSETSHEATTQAANAISAKLDSLSTRMTESQAAYSAIQLPPTAPTSSVSKAEFNTFCQNFEHQKMKYEDALVAVKNFERNKCKERITALEAKRTEIDDAQSAIANAQAAYVTSEQMDSAVQGLKATLESQIESYKRVLEKAIGKQQCYEWIEGVRQKHDVLVSAYNKVSSPVTMFSGT
jgi:chromosome segregation ATPase